MTETLHQTKHVFKLEERSHAQITGVTEVSSFHENEIILKIEEGVMVVFGENLRVGKLIIEAGELDIVGRIDGIHYEMSQKIGRLFRIRKK